MPQETTSATTERDPSGVPRPVDPDRIDKAKGNSGIMVGEVASPTQTTAGTQQDQYKTAFIKVYQDAGVIGVAMLTLLALCVAMAMFSSRVLKMYSALVTANTLLVNTSAEATLKIATAMTVLDSQIKAASTEAQRDATVMMQKLDEILARQARIEDRFEMTFRMMAARPGQRIDLPSLPSQGEPQ